MEERILSAYDYYHNERPGFLVFFKLEDGYTAFHEDARVAATVLRRPIVFNGTALGKIVLAEYEFFDMLDRLDMYDIHAIAVTYRDEDGLLAVPDVEDFVFDDMWDED